MGEGWRRMARGGMVAVACAGCSSDTATEGPGAAVRDSAGIGVVSVPARDTWELPTWSVADTPTIRVGSIDGPLPTQLHRVRGGTRLSDGRIVVLNAGSRELRYFDARGEFEFAVGGEGDGPEEFRALAHAGRMRGDSVAAYDARHFRHVVYGPDGAIGRSHTFEVSERFPRPLGTFPNGDLLVRLDERWSRSSEPGPVRRNVEFARMAPQSGVFREIVTLPGEQAIFHRHGAFFTQRQLTFGRAPHAAVTGRDRVRVVAGSSDAYEFHLFADAAPTSADGPRSPVLVVRVDHDPRPVEPGRFEFVRDSVLGTSGGEDTREFWRSLYAAMPRLETYPAYLDLRGDTEGNVWVREEPGASAPSDTWTVFDPEGTPLATIRLPERLQVLEIGADYVLAVEEDDLETEYVGLYPLRK